MKPTQLMIDAAYEAALVATTAELARNSGKVNYRVVIEAALVEAMAIMPKPEELKPAVPEVAYSVSRTEDGENWAGVAGPYPKLSMALGQTGADDGCFIVKHDLDGSTTALYRWNDDETKWARY